MPILLSSDVSVRVFEFAVAVASAARLFTIPQIARHSDLSWRSQPERRAREVLNMYGRSFEKIPGPHHQPTRWRLSTVEKRKRGIVQTAVNGVSQKAPHWLGIGDVWISLTFAGGRPTEWRTEWENQFDIYFVWCNRPYLIEYQRTPITSRQWRAKWHKRLEWYKQQSWAVRPRVVLLNTTSQTSGTICLPRGTIHVRSIDDLPNALKPPRL